MRGRLPVLVLLLLLAPLASPAAALVEGPEGALVLATDTTYSDGTYVFRENLVVGPGVTLTFHNAVVFLDAPSFCPTRGSAGYCQPSILLDGGRLRILDSVVDAHAWDPHDPDAGWSVAGVGAVIEIRDSTLTRYKSLGTQSPGDAPSVVRDSLFVHARGALSFIRGAVADVRGNTFQDVYAGVSFHDSESTLVGNVFRDVGRDFGAGLFGRAIDVQATLVGEKAYRALTLVEGNLVENATQGMLNLNGFPNEIRNNVFRRNQQALTIGLSVGTDILHSDAPLVTGNLFDDNQDGVFFYTSGVFRIPDTGAVIWAHIHGNSFLDRCTEVFVGPINAQVELIVDARENWWGSAAGPQDRSEGCPALTGNVRYDPWLTSAP